MVRRPRLARMPARCALSASLDGMGGGDAEFMKRIEELAAAVGVQPAGAAGCGWPASVERSASNVGRRERERWEGAKIFSEPELGKTKMGTGRRILGSLSLEKEVFWSVTLCLYGT